MPVRDQEAARRQAAPDLRDVQGRDLKVRKAV
jgi:hypothetical protein